MQRRPPQPLSGDLVVIYLRELCDRMADQAAQGVFASKSFSVTTTWYTLEIAWLRCTIFNDGDSDVYIRLDDMSTSPWQMGEAPLKKGEQVSIDLHAKQYPPQMPTLEEEVKEGKEGVPRVAPLRHGAPLLCFICQTGSATVRVFRLA